MSALPRSIQASLDAADQIQSAIVGVPGAEPTPPANEPNAETDPPPQPQVVEERAEPEPAPPASSKRTDDAALWEQRYRVLEGKYNAEVPRMAAEIRELKGAIELQLARANRPEPSAEPVKPKALVTQQDIEAFGGDLVDLIGRKAQEVAAEREAALLKRIEDLNSQLATFGQKQEMSDQDRYLMNLGAEVPNFRQINDDPRWHQWLLVQDPLTGARRQDYLNVASNARDVARTAAIFRAFMAEVTPAASTNKGQQDVQQELQRQVAPARSAASTAPSQPAAASKIWTSKEITKFYDDVRRGFISPKDAERIESELNAAMAEGRIR